MVGCPDFPEELSKLSLIEQPSALYCETKADLWRHINDSELEEVDSDSGYCSPYHSQLKLLPAVNPSYLPVITHTGQLMIVPHDSLPYRFSRDGVVSSTLEHSVIANNGGTGSQPSWQNRHSAAVNAADKTVLLTTDFSHSAGTHMSRQSSLRCRQHSTAVVMSEIDNSTRTVSDFVSIVYDVLCMELLYVHCVSKKRHPFYFCYNFVRRRLI